jgi:hypothetical protein
MNARRRGRRRKRLHLIKSVRKHPTIYGAVFASVASVGGVDWLFQIPSLSAQLIVALAVFLAVILVRFFASLEWGAVYVIEGYHPVSGKPICIYVGETSQRTWTDSRGAVHYPRIEQHLLGSARYGVSAQPWSDTVIRWYFTYESQWSTRSTRLFLEFVNIKIRRPIYNYKRNLANSRRIPIPEQHRQRAERDRLHSLNR